MDHQNDEKQLSFGRLGILGIQHVLAMGAGTILVPLILGAALGLSKQELSYLISADFFTCGIATIIQAKGISRFIGIKLPVVMGCSSLAIIPMIVVGKIYGIPAIYGAVIVSGLLVLLAAPLFHIIRKLFPTVVIGSIVTIIGLSLIIIALKNIVISSNGGPIDLKTNIFLALLVLFLIVIVNKYSRGFLQAIAILLSLVVGTLVAYFLGLVNLSVMHQANIGWFHIIKPFYFGVPQFKISAIAAICMASFIDMIVSIGVFFVVGKICEREIKDQDIAAGFRAEGIAQVLGGIFNAFPYITFSQNVGLVVLTNVKSHYAVVAAGVILILLGCIPKIAAVISVVPLPVLGGAMLVLFGIVAATGIRILSGVNFSNSHNLLIIGISLSVGLGSTVFSDLFASASAWIKVLFSNGIMIGSLVALFLNALFNGLQGDN